MDDLTYGERARRTNALFVRDVLPHPVLVKTHWLALKSATGPLEFDDIGFSVFSQNNEDGILMYLLSRIGFTSRLCVEVGCNTDNSTVGIPEGNTINLIVNFGCHGLIIDMDISSIQAIQHFFASALSTRHFHQASDLARADFTTDYYSPVLASVEVAPETFDATLERAGFGGEVDVMSIDIDGNDVHLMDSLSIASPRILVMEINSRLPFETDFFAGPSAPWGESFDEVAARQSWGASLSLMVRVARQKGYVFVGLSNNLINAFFVRRDAFIGSGLREMDPSEYSNHRMRPPESRLVRRS